MLIMVVLAITSNGFSQRLLGQYWKKVQRLSYLAGLTMAIHWILIDQFIDSLLLLAVPLIVLQFIRVCLARLNFLGARQTSK